MITEDGGMAMEPSEGLAEEHSRAKGRWEPGAGGSR